MVYEDLKFYLPSLPFFHEAGSEYKYLIKTRFSLFMHLSAYNIQSTRQQNYIT